MPRSRARTRLGSLIVRGWWGARRGVLDSVPRPRDSPIVSAPGPDPLRVVLLGNGPAVGYGVTSNTLALPGHLARQLAALTGRGVEVQLIADRGLLARNAAARFVEHGRPPYDLAITLVGSPDAVYLTPVDDWRRGITFLLERLREGAGAVLVVGIPPTSALRMVPSLAVDAIAEHTVLLNDVARDAAERVGARHLDFAPPPEHDRERHRSSTTYGQWAALIAGPAADLLEGLGRR